VLEDDRLSLEQLYAMLDLDHCGSVVAAATSSLDAIAAAAGSSVRTELHVLNVPGRQWHSRRVQKARPKFPHATATKRTITGKPEVTVFAPGFY
jgi:hypothetical protein